VNRALTVVIVGDRVSDNGRAWIENTTKGLSYFQRSYREISFRLHPVHILNWVNNIMSVWHKKISLRHECSSKFLLVFQMPPDAPRVEYADTFWTVFAMRFPWLWHQNDRNRNKRVTLVRNVEEITRNLPVYNAVSGKSVRVDTRGFHNGTYTVLR
jgi:hypothetical protein